VRPQGTVATVPYLTGSVPDIEQHGKYYRDPTQKIKPVEGIIDVYIDNNGVCCNRFYNDDFENGCIWKVCAPAGNGRDRSLPDE